MSISPTATFPPSAEPQAEQGKVRVEEAQTFSSGNASPAEISRQQSSPVSVDRGKDEVKLHWQPPGETAVYQFLNQKGSVILQVPSEQELNLGREISQELAQAAIKEAATVEGGKANGH
jgi:hypothetical protein